jgi:magnesium transporter
MAVQVYREDPDTFTWLDIANPTDGELEMLSRRYQLNPYTLADSLEPDHLPKHEMMEETHFIIMRTLIGETPRQADSVQEMTNKLAIFYSEDFLVTIHRADQKFLQELAASNHLSNTAAAGDMVIRILEKVLATYDNPALALSKQVDELEKKVFLQTVVTGVPEDIYYTRRKASVCHKLLLLSSEAINAVRYGDPVALQDVKDLHVKLLHMYGQVNDDLKNLLNIYLSTSAQKTGDVMKVLTIFSVFFMPLTFIAGIYGMNFEVMPELEKSWGYPAALILMACTALGIFYWFRRKRWL